MRAGDVPSINYSLSQEYLENFVHLPRGEETLTWSIKIYPKGNGENNKDFVFLCLNRVVAPVSKHIHTGWEKIAMDHGCSGFLRDRN